MYIPLYGQMSILIDKTSCVIVYQQGRSLENPVTLQKGSLFCVFLANYNVQAMYMPIFKNSFFIILNVKNLTE